MNRTFFVLALLVLLAPSPARATSPLQKCAIAAEGFNVPLFNTFNNDVWMGTDAVTADQWYTHTQGAYVDVTAEYIPRFPNTAHAELVRNSLSIPTFRGKIVISNEPDLWGYSPADTAAKTEANVREILSALPDAYIIFSITSQAHFPDYATDTWALLPDWVKAEIDALGIHYYPYSLDPIEVRSYLRKQVRPWANQRNIEDVWLTETGLWEAPYRTIEDARAYIPKLWAELETFEWLKGVCWYYHNTDGQGYMTLVNPQQTKPTKAGAAWKEIP